MKKIKILALSAAILGTGWGVSLTPVLADHGKMTTEEHVKNLKDKLDLTPEQETQVRTIVEDKKSRVEEAKNEAHEKIRNVLTTEQQDKFNKLIMEKEKERN